MKPLTGYEFESAVEEPISVIVPPGDFYDPLLKTINSETSVCDIDLIPLSLLERVKKEYFNPHVMKAVQCLVQTLTKLDHLTLLDYLTNPKVVGKGSVGVAFTVDYKSLKELCVIKTVIDDSFSTLLEYWNGIHLNALREFTPNFVYLYGSVKCSPALLTITNFPSKSSIHWCNKEGSTRYLIYENLRPATEVYSLIENKVLTNDDCTSMVFQILLSLEIAYTKLKFTHYDLHLGNVMARKLDKPQYIKYTVHGKDYYVYSNYVFTIIDYGFAHTLNYGGDYIGSYSMTNPYPANDMIRMLGMGAYFSKQGKLPISIFMDGLSYFFDPSYFKDIVDEKGYLFNNRYSVPIISKWKNVKYIDLINYLLKIPSILKIVSLTPQVPLFGCSPCPEVTLYDRTLVPSLNTLLNREEKDPEMFKPGILSVLEKLERYKMEMVNSLLKLSDLKDTSTPQDIITYLDTAVKIKEKLYQSHNLLQYLFKVNKIYPLSLDKHPLWILDLDNTLIKKVSKNGSKFRTLNELPDHRVRQLFEDIGPSILKKELTTTLIYLITPIPK